MDEIDVEDEADDEDAVDEVDKVDEEVDEADGELKKVRDDDDYDHDGTTNGAIDTADTLIVSPDLKQITRYETAGRITSLEDFDYFALTPSDLEIDDLEYLSVTIRTADTEGLIPAAVVYNEAGEQLESRVLANANGLLVLQASDVDPSETHFIRVGAAKAHKTLQSGPYDLVAQYSAEEKKLSKLTSGRLRREEPSEVVTLYIPQTRLVHVAFQVEEIDERAPILAWAVIYDEAGRPVSQVAAPAGETRSARTVLLQPGAYRLEFHAGRKGTTQIPEIDYQLFADGITIPIGPGISDPTGSPILPCDDAGADPTYCSPPDIIITDPIVFPNTIPVPPAPVVSVQPPWTDFDWWYWDDASFGAIQAATPAALPATSPTTAASPNTPIDSAAAPVPLPTDALPALDTSTAGELRTNVLHNPVNGKDVNGDGILSAMDVLAVVNYLNSRNLSERAPSAFVDVNDDSFVSSIDALLITNELNAATALLREGEANLLSLQPDTANLDALMTDWDELTQNFFER